MVNLNKMYDGVVNSPETYLTQNLAADATIIYVADSSVFGSLPNLAVIGTDQNAETILITSKRSDGGLEVQRALEGPAKRWEKTTAIARNFTNYDYNQVKSNIEKLNTGKQESLTAGSNIQITNGRISATDTKYNDTQIKKDIAELQNSQLSKANQTEAESGVDNTKFMTPQTTKQAIEKLSPKQDLSSYAMKKDIKTKLSEMVGDSTHRTVTDSEKEKWNSELEKASQSEAQTATNDTKYMTPLRTKDAILKLASKQELKEVVVPFTSNAKDKNEQEITFWTDGKIVYYFIQLDIKESDSSVFNFKVKIPFGFRGKTLKTIPLIQMTPYCSQTKLMASNGFGSDNMSIFVEPVSNKKRQVHYFGFYPLDTEVEN